MKESDGITRSSDSAKTATSAIRFGADAAGERFVEITRDGRTALLPVIDLMLPPRSLARKLAINGVTLTGPHEFAKLQAEINAANKQVTFTVARLPGWQSKTAYLHGERLIGRRPPDLVFDRSTVLLGDRPAKFSVQGRLTDWQADARTFAIHQPLITFLLASAFAAAILERLNIQPFVINLWGPSSVGKSSAARFAGALYGGDPQRRELGFAESFKATDAGLEKLALAHNDALLILDEFGRVQGSARERVRLLEAAVKDLCSGTPKTRATDAHGGLAWSTVGIITSNESYATLLRNAGLEADEALGPRMIELYADLGTGWGIYKALPADFSDSQAAVKSMQAAAEKHFGVAISAFAEAIIERDIAEPGAVDARIAECKERFETWAGGDLDPVQRHLSEKFGGINAAGRLAKDLGVFPPEINVWSAVLWAWRSLGQSGVNRGAHVVATVSRHIRRNRDRFLTTPIPRGSSAAAAQRARGFNHDGEQGPEILLPKARFQRAFSKIGGARAVMPVLFKKDLAFAEDPEGKRWQVKRSLNKDIRMRFYAIKASILKDR